MVHRYLFADERAFFIGHLVEVEFVAEGAGERHDSAGGEGGGPVRLVVRTVRNVRPYGGGGVEHAAAVLDFQPLDRVGVVAGPDLGDVIEHPRIEPAAAAGTAFDQQFRVAFQQLLVEFVHAEYVTVADFHLAGGGHGGGADFGEVAVGVPLNLNIA